MLECETRAEIISICVRTILRLGPKDGGNRELYMPEFQGINAYECTEVHATCAGHGIRRH
jgi:hypothetical protein